MKKFLGILFCAVFILAPLTGFAEDCVEVDIELTPVAAPDSSGLMFAEFSLELTNCGTEPTMMELSAVLETGAPQVIPPLTFSFPVAAGETVVHSWVFPVPPIVPAGIYEVCVTATSGTATATDCASLEVSGGSGTSAVYGDETGRLAAGSMSEDCVDIDIELTPTTAPDSSGLMYVEFSLELTNCGTEPAMAALTAELLIGVPVPPYTFYYPVGAGETVVRSWVMPVPPIVPSGTYEICVTAQIGVAEATDCASIEIAGSTGAAGVDNGGSGVVLSQNYPNPFNLGTGISFALENATDVKLTIHNILGQTVTTLADGHFTAGSHNLQWDGLDSHGNVVPTGIYLYRLSTNDQQMTKKMILMK